MDQETLQNLLLGIIALEGGIITYVLAATTVPVRPLMAKPATQPSAAAGAAPPPPPPPSGTTGGGDSTGTKRPIKAIGVTIVPMH